jgi:predicted PurR-regulated permease PerM
LFPVAFSENMNWFDGMVSLPALAVLYGLTFGGRLGAIAGFVAGVVAGSLGLYLTTHSTRVDRIARRVEALERERDAGKRGDGGPD